MKRISLFSGILLLTFTIFGQSQIENVLKEVEQNNTTLSALRKNTESEKILNKTGIFLQNPEVEFNYLWGNPVVIGNRTDFSIRQRFDFPTAYGYRNQISELKNDQADLQYQKSLKALLYETKLICNDLVYTNALKYELAKRFEHAQNIAQSYKTKFELGGINVLEFNKAQLYLLKMTKAVESNETERIALLAELTRLNGGKAIAFDESVFAEVSMKEDFDQWFQSSVRNNPFLEWLNKEVEISQRNIQLNKALNLPKFEAGYMSEVVVGEQFRGITAGMAIPLWENKNKIKAAKSNALTMESVAADHALQYYNHLKALHSKAVSLKKNATDYRSGLLLYNNAELLKTALDKGEISLINYLTELSFYYESIQELLEVEKELFKVVAEIERGF
ncbi:MAG: TolC family protein [Bacteroidales bacterium]|nr:TolC family protein [Bacteroidales bacterium]